MDIQTKAQEVEELNQSLRIKDDAITQLSDQVMTLIARMQEIERKQSL